MNIIAHRGLWFKFIEQNTLIAFERALLAGFGIETDLRDYNKKIVISHDMPNEKCLPLEQFLNLCNKYPNATLALNIKADGLQSELLKVKVINHHFYFDMSVPDSLGYIKENLSFYTRYSDIENTPSFYMESKGIWLDNFTSNNIDLIALERFLAENKSVVLVSPELHKLCEKNYWKDIKCFLKSHPAFIKKISICTDFPEKARDYFNV